MFFLYLYLRDKEVGCAFLPSLLTSLLEHSHRKKRGREVYVELRIS